METYQNWLLSGRLLASSRLTCRIERLLSSHGLATGRRLQPVRGMLHQEKVHVGGGGVGEVVSGEKERKKEKI